MTVGTVGNMPLSISSHVMTSKEVEAMSASIGVRQDGINANKIIDGFGTGLAAPTSEQWAGMVGSVSVTDSVTGAGTVSSTATFDISTQPYFPIIGNQGSQGSCAAWAMTYYAYGYLEAKDNGWTDASTGNPAHLMSPAWTYNMLNAGLNAGTTMSSNAQVISGWGAATLATMPYVVSDITSWGSEAAFREAPLHRALSYSYINYDTANGANTVASLKALLASNVPVTFAIDASQFGAALNSLTGDFVISASEYTSTTYNHAGTLVGYDDTKTDGHTDVGAFKVANSWGTGFGDKGYYWISYDTLKEIGANGKLFLTYITDRAHYQPSLVAEVQFSTLATRDAWFTVGVGAIGSTTKVTSFYAVNYPYVTITSKFPSFMLLDISDLQSTYASGVTSFYLTLGTTNTPGVISSFRTAQYLNGYTSAATLASGQSPNVPVANPCSVTVSMTSGTAITVPGTPTSVTVTAGSSSISVGWAAPASNGGSAITGYNIYRGTASGAETLLTSVSSTLRSYTDSTAVAGTTYYYQVAAVNSIGTSARSSEASAKLVPTVTVPSVPTGLTALVSGTSITLSWTAPTSNGGAAITSYNVYKGTSAGGESTTPLGTSTNQAYTDSSIVAGTTYYYVVRAVNSVGVSPASNEASNRIATVPSTPTGLTASVTGSSISLGWTAPASNGGSAMTGYNIYRGTASGAETPLTSVASTAGSYTDSTAVAGTTYYYQVAAVNSVGTSARSTEVSARVSSTVTVPSAPSGLTATQTSGKIALVWTAPTSNGGSSITSYSIYRGISSSLGDQASIGTVTAIGYTDTTATVGTTYYYTVKANNVAGSSLASGYVSVQAKGVPGAPSGVSASASSGSITVTWSAPTNTGFSAITGYKVYRSTISGSETLLVTLGSTLTYTDNGLTNAQTYYYKITAVNAMGESVQSSEVSATPASTGSVPGGFTLTVTPGDSLVTLSWTKPTSNPSLTRFDVMRKTGGTETTIASVSGTSTGYVDTAVIPGTDYTYRVVAVNSVGSTTSTSTTVHAVYSVSLTMQVATSGKGTVISGLVSATSTGKTLSGETVLVYHSVGATGTWTQIAQLTTSSKGKYTTTIKEPTGVTIGFKVVVVANTYHASVSQETNLVALAMGDGTTAGVISSQLLAATGYDASMGEIRFTVESDGSVAIIVPLEAIEDPGDIHVSVAGVAQNATVTVMNDSYVMTLTGLVAGQEIVASISHSDHDQFSPVLIAAIFALFGGIIGSILYARSKRAKV